MANPGPLGLSAAYIDYHASHPCINTVLDDLWTDGYIVKSHTTAIPQWSLPAVWENKLFQFEMSIQYNTQMWGNK